MAQEKNLENRVKKWLQSVGIYPVGTPKNKMAVAPKGYYEKRFGNAFVVAGLPDMHISVLSEDIEIELKAPNGKPSDLQLHMIEQMSDTGAIAYVLYENLPDKYKNDKRFIDFDRFKYLILNRLGEM